MRMKRPNGDRSFGRLLILGYGRSGRSVAEHCREHGIDFSVSEEGILHPEDHAWLCRHAVRFEAGGHSLRALQDIDVVVLSPGIPMDNLLVRAAVESGVDILSEIDYSSAFISDKPIIAVTGTNGKTTVVSLIGALLQGSGRAVRIAGNIGTPYASIVDETADCDVVVLEVSSYQLEQSRFFHPQIAVLLNLTPDHLSRHRTMGAYASAKGRLFERQTAFDAAVLPYELRAVFKQGKATRFYFDHPLPSMPAHAAELPSHLRANLAAALTSACILIPDLNTSVNLATLQDALHLPYRLQRVGRVGDVQIINDSKSTNGGSTAAALRAMTGPTVLLLGGRHKRAGYETMAEEIQAATMRRTVLFGEAAAFFESLLGGEGQGAELEVVADLDQAVAAGLDAARSGDTLLFSPGCASFDQFPDYIARGEAFTKAILKHVGYAAD